MLALSARRLSGSAAGASRQWMQQQSKDPFVAEARRKGYIARSAFKLTFLDDRFGVFTRGQTRAVVDLGCSPGGWCQVARERCGDGCLLFGVDLLPVKASVPNAIFLQGDFNSPELRESLLEKLGGHSLLPTAAEGRLTCGGGAAPSAGRVDVVLSDMCPNRMGGTQDRQRIAALDQQALAFSLPLLRPGGHFVCKVLGSKPSYEDLHAALGRTFLKVHVCKPPASRQHSDESFLVGHTKLAEPRRGSLNARGRAVLNGPGDGGGGGGRYGLDDWPGFARTPERKKSGRNERAGAPPSTRGQRR